MKLTVVIVNYNVRYFLSACLKSVLAASGKIDSEIIVVDNNSSDHSAEMLQADFPTVRLIRNNFNAGFSKANNQAIGVSRGEHILLLNPDTIVGEDCFEKCIEFIDSHPDAGGLGVKMIDGSGRFLPESKRGLPTPLVAFYKIFGLSRLFPGSRRFGKYHLGYLPENELCEIDVLSGAFMWLRKSVIDKTGGLDEDFFMYGEDIDLSYRILKSGYKNYYFPEVRLIHFKGESTKKSSVNYVLVFYSAMIVFAQKHFNNPNARIFSILIKSAIYFRALLAIFRRIAIKLYMPILDGTLFWLFLTWLKKIYENTIIGVEGYYPDQVETIGFPLMIVSWIFTQYLLGGYHQPARMKSIFKGLLTGAVLIIFSYAMLDETLRFSRGIIAIAVTASFVFIPLLRMGLNKLGLFELARMAEINLGIVGRPEDILRVKDILSGSGEKKRHLYFIDPLKRSESQSVRNDIEYIGSLYQLKDILSVYCIRELVFCMNGMSTNEMIEDMQSPFLKKMAIYLNPPESDFILRSSSMTSLGEFIRTEDNAVMKDWSRRRKRFFEFAFALLMTSLSPLVLFLYRNPLQFLKNMTGILSGRLQLVGCPVNGAYTKNYLLTIPAIDSPGERQRQNSIAEYTIDYGIEKDLEIVLSKLSFLDKMPAEQLEQQ